MFYFSSLFTYILMDMPDMKASKANVEEREKIKAYRFGARKIFLL